MSTKELVIADIDRRYDNPIPKLVQVACQFTSELLLVSGTKTINAKSIMGVMAMKPSQGMPVMIQATGQDAAAACEAMEHFLLCE